ncbi:MAG: DUF1178 family protein, partial [Sphingomonadales bacterium]
MIVFDLRCGQGHVFEAWFGSTAAYDAQNAGGLVLCPICGNQEIAKAVMAPNVGAKGNQGPAIPLEAMKAAMSELAEAQARVLKNSTWVGT